jgi:hypothetical protein
MYFKQNFHYKNEISQIDCIFKNLLETYIYNVELEI